jgi:hypothetical protein
MSEAKRYRLAEACRNEVTHNGLVADKDGNLILYADHRAQLAKVAESKWISVKERLPNFDVKNKWDCRTDKMTHWESNYLLFVHNGRVGFGQAVLKVPSENKFEMVSSASPKTVTAFSGVLMWNGGECDFEGVTHWQPLPEPPATDQALSEGTNA